MINIKLIPIPDKTGLRNAAPFCVHLFDSNCYGLARAACIVGVFREESLH